MEHNSGHPTFTLLSIGGAIFGWIMLHLQQITISPETLKSIQVFMTLLATGVSVISGLYTIYTNYRKNKNGTNNN